MCVSVGEGVCARAGKKEKLEEWGGEPAPLPSSRRNVGTTLMELLVSNTNQHTHKYIRIYQRTHTQLVIYM